MTPLIVIVRLTSELPGPGQPTFPRLCGTFGGFVGIAIGRLRQFPWERTARLMAEAGAVGYGIGFIGWVVTIAMDRL